MTSSQPETHVWPTLEERQMSTAEKRGYRRGRVREGKIVEIPKTEK